VYCHERDRVHETFGIEEPFKVVVLFFLLNIALKFVHIKVSLGMPLLVLKVLHVGNGVLASEFTLQVKSGCLKRPKVDDGKNI